MLMATRIPFSVIFIIIPYFLCKYILSMTTSVWVTSELSFYTYCLTYVLAKMFVNFYTCW